MQIILLCLIKSFLSNIAKTSSVAGILQFTNPESEKNLMKFCMQELNLSDANNIKLSANLESELLAIWPLLMNIKEANSQTFLPTDVSAIMLDILNIRKEIFWNAPERFLKDYYPWNDYSSKPQPSNQLHDHPTSCFPTLPFKICQCNVLGWLLLWI